MAIVLIRVDERLIHGQVVIGWGNQLRPSRYVVVDDELARSEWEQDLYRLAVPGGVRSEFVTVDEATEQFSGWHDDSERTVVLLKSLEAATRLCRSGALRDQVLNLGGLHHREGKAAVCRYLFLDDEDRGLLREMVDSGVGVSGQDLPASARLTERELIGGD